MADSPIGTTAAFATSSWSAEITGMSIDGEEVSVLDVTHYGVTGYREKIFGKLIEPPAVEFEFIFDPNDPPPLGTLESGTFTFPIPTGDSNGATLAGTGALVARSFELGDADEGQPMKGSVTWQFDGKTGPTFTDSS